MGEVRKLSLGDIADLREYERERPEFQQRVFGAKRQRRVVLGPIMSVVFENALTIRYQIQEMARVEKMTTDAQISDELRVYNPLIPDPGELSATVFLELTDEAELREWLPKLVGIERAVLLGLGQTDRTYLRCTPDEGHAAQLTREEVTASVHYIRFALSPPEIDRFEAGPAFLACDHPAYRAEVELSEVTRKELVGDLRG